MLMTSLTARNQDMGPLTGGPAPTSSWPITSRAQLSITEPRPLSPLCFQVSDLHEGRGRSFTGDEDMKGLELRLVPVWRPRLSLRGPPMTFDPGGGGRSDPQ